MITDNRKFWKLLLFTIPTFGIYNIVFWYRLTKDLNEMTPNQKKTKNYILVIFLSIITFGIYHWVWFFYLCDKIETTGKRYKINVLPGAGTMLGLKTFGTFFILGPFIANYLAIHNMNNVAHAYNKSLNKQVKSMNKKKISA